MIRIPILVITTEQGNKLKELLKQYSDFILRFQSCIPENDNLEIEVFLQKNDKKF